jgi:multidrug efflux system membrane fusion protein
MKRAFYIVVLAAIAVAFYVFAYPRLTGHTSASAQQAAAPASKARAGGGPAVGVVTVAARQQTLPISKSEVGYIEPVATVILRSQADGIIVQQNVIEGQMVKAGDVLFKLDDQAVQATIAKDQAQIAKDQANADVAKAGLVREQDLVKKGVDPQSLLDAAVAVSKSADATVVVDQAQLRADQVTLKHMTITAPTSGRVGTVNTSVGNLVHASDTSAGGLLTITAMDPVRVSFTVAESDLDSFRTALAGSRKLPVDVLAPGDTSPRATGTLSFIDSSVDTASGTVVIKADVGNAAGKHWPGQYVTAVTRLGAYDNATTVPLQAVQQSSNGPYVYAIGAGEKVKRQPVTMSATVDQTAIISAGVKPGDHVVIEGQLHLNDGATVKETLQAATPATALTPTIDTTGASPVGNS